MIKFENILNENDAHCSDYGIGTKFVRYGSKRNDIETIVDIYTTTNFKGDVIKVEYITEHEFAGQIVKGIAMRSTIARSKIISQDK